ncbi:PqiC family protein [Thiohalocapsa halophila]|nr:PqiC family protein [Thiohalocapsa halophila]
MLVLRLKGLTGRLDRSEADGSAHGLAGGRRRRFLRWSLAFTAMLLLAGCATTPPSSFYTLTPLPQAAGRAGDLGAGSIAVGLGPVTFPQFLDRPQIVTRDGANRLVVDEFHRWGGTVQDDFLRVWGENLAYLLGGSRVALFPSESRMPLDYRVLAQVLAFEGAADGNAVLRVRWSVTDDRQRRTFAARENVYRCPYRVGGGDDRATADIRYAAVVAALSECLGDFSRDVAEVLGGLPEPQPPAADAAVSSAAQPRR